jgi:hypothetical protein
VSAVSAASAGHQLPRGQSAGRVAQQYQQQQLGQYLPRVEMVASTAAVIAANDRE